MFRCFWGPKFSENPNFRPPLQVANCCHPGHVFVDGAYLGTEVGLKMVTLMGNMISTIGFLGTIFSDKPKSFWSTACPVQSFWLLTRQSCRLFLGWEKMRHKWKLAQNHLYYINDNHTWYVIWNIYIYTCAYIEYMYMYIYIWLYIYEYIYIMYVRVYIYVYLLICNE